MSAASPNDIRGLRALLCLHRKGFRLHAHQRRHPQQKIDLAVLVSPLWARLTRFLRHPHTLRTVQSQARAAELARCCNTVDDFRGRREDFTQCNDPVGVARLAAMPVSREFQGSKENANYQMDVGCWFRSRQRSSYRGHRATVLARLGGE